MFTNPHKYRLEKKHETKLKTTVENQNAWILKFVSPSMDSLPDRIILAPGGIVEFVEVKADGKPPNKKQLYRHEQLRKLGFRVTVLDSDEEARNYTIDRTRF